MRNSLKLAVCLLAALSVVSCASDSKGDNTDSLSVMQSFSKSHTYILQGSAADYFSDSDVSVTDSVSLILPMLLDGTDASIVCDSILSRAMNVKGCSDIATAVDTWFKNNMDEVTSETGYKAVQATTSPVVSDGFCYIEGGIVNMTPRLFVYCITTSTYLPGAANGSYTLDYINYSFEMKRTVSLDDLFTPEGLKELPAVINEQAHNNPRYGDSVSIDALPAGGEYYLSSEGEIVFVYQPMEVAPHSVGAVQVAFMPAELLRYLTPQAIKNFGLTDLAGE